VVAASPVVALILQWHTKIKFVTDLPVAYSMGILALDSRAFKRLSESDQQITRTIMEGVNQRLDEQARVDNQRAREVMEELGISFIPVDPVDVSNWHSVISKIYPRISSRDEIDEEFFDLVGASRTLGTLVGKCPAVIFSDRTDRFGQHPNSHAQYFIYGISMDR
jgi:hypothetical protein